jgi:phage protein D/phage baseplate assembly protein gpV
MSEYYVPDFDVKIQGILLSADVKNAIVSLSYDNNLGQADEFSLTLDNSGLRFIDSAIFDVGREVEIYMGYAGNLQPMMLGDIVSIQPGFPAGGAPTLTIGGYDKSHRMRHNHKRSSFRITNPTAIVSQIAAENLLIPVVDPIPVFSLPDENKIQDGSDMEFLTELGRRYYIEPYVHWDKLYFRFPRPQLEAVKLEWGKNLNSFSPRLSTSGISGMMVLQDYNQQLAQKIVGFVPILTADFDWDDIAIRFGDNFVNMLKELGTKYVSHEKVNSYPDALGFAKAMVQEMLEGLFEGNGSCIGLPGLRAGEMVEISGLGKRFSGTYRLKRVTHSIDSGGYQTSFEVSQHGGSSLINLFKKYLEPKNSKNNAQPVIATVKNNVDTKKEGRVEVEYPNEIRAWAKVIQPDTGTYFMPDVGENVFVTFENGDIDRPLVTGVLWNVKKQPTENATPNNYKRVIKSREGHKIMLNDDPQEGGIFLETALGAKVIIDNKGNIKIESTGDVNVNNGNKGAARLNDSVEVTIPSNSFLISPNTLNPNPVSVKGKIISSSNTVKIGD